MSPRHSPLADPRWVVDHLDDPSVVLLEVDDRPALYHRGHLPGAQLVDWHHDLQDPVQRDLPHPTAVHRLWQELGINADSTVIFYGDLHNWLAAYGYWLFRTYGLDEVQLLDGGRQYWLANNLPLTDAPPTTRPPATPPTVTLRPQFRANRRRAASAARRASLVDVRTPQEYTGEWLTEPEFPHEVAHRRGHIPGATSVP